MLQRLIHEPRAQEIGQPLLTLSSLNKIDWLIDWLIESAQRCLQQQSKGIDAKKRRVLLYSSRDEPSNSDILKKEIDDLKEQLRPKTNEVNQLSDPVKTLKMQNETYQSQLQKFAHTTEKTTFLR